MAQCTTWSPGHVFAFGPGHLSGTMEDHFGSPNLGSGNLDRAAPRHIHACFFTLSLRTFYASFTLLSLLTNYTYHDVQVRSVHFTRFRRPSGHDCRASLSFSPSVESPFDGALPDLTHNPLWPDAGGMSAWPGRRGAGPGNSPRLGDAPDHLLDEPYPSTRNVGTVAHLDYAILNSPLGPCSGLRAESAVPWLTDSGESFR
jgi:hypothetical protein